MFSLFVQQQQQQKEHKRVYLLRFKRRRELLASSELCITVHTIMLLEVLFALRFFFPFFYLIKSIRNVFLFSDYYAKKPWSCPTTKFVTSQPLPLTFILPYTLPFQPLLRVYEFMFYVLSSFKVDGFWKITKTVSCDGETAKKVIERERKKSQL